MPTFEICTNHEALREYCGLDFSELNDGVPGDTPYGTFLTELRHLLEDLGYETIHAKGQRSLCHGWNGANTFKHKIGPVGTFDELSAEDLMTVYNVIDVAMDTTLSTWRDVTSNE